MSANVPILTKVAVSNERDYIAYVHLILSYLFRVGSIRQTNIDGKGRSILILYQYFDVVNGSLNTSFRAAIDAV